ncbi:Serine rich endogenous peptide 5 [Cardamine amara subsp. amara]|uniref:Serine rich endogenous peptide 5 n=1 Tax=Cardamine amara subsp. amara TaxID=228776 RepID=A0ABD1BS39_CARAN
MALKTSNSVSLLLSLFILLVFISSQVGVADAKRLQQRNEIGLDCAPLLPPPPPPPRIGFPPIVVPPSKSRKGKGP